MNSYSKQRCIRYKYEIGPISGTCLKTGFQCTGNPEVCKEEEIEISDEQLEIEQKCSTEWNNFIRGTSLSLSLGFSTQVDTNTLQREILKLRLEMQLMETRIMDYIKSLKKEQ